MKKRKLLIGVALGLFIVTGTVYTLFFTHPIRQRTYVHIDTNDNIDSVYAKLQHEADIQSLAGFKVLNTLLGYADDIKPGAYRFGPETNALTIFRRMRNGNQTPVQLTIPSVRTLGRLIKTVAKQLMTDSTTLARLLTDSLYCSRLGYTPETVPALFIPNTYEVYWTITPEDFISKMQEENKRFWTPKRVQKAQELGLTPVQVSIVASIVEEETANNAEKPMVAGLYLNRLQQGMPLQADPTVKFGLQNFGLRRILTKHIQTDTPYNTYLHEGLPPGPIRIPSIVGIESVLNRTRHNYVYMCAKEDFSGTHNFAVTYAEHQVNARKYQQALNARNIK